MTLRPFSIVISAAALAWAIPAVPYKISVLGRFHERLTVLSEQCLRSAQGAYPIKCENIPSSREKFLKVPWRAERYWFDSRWPDDPTRQTGGTGVFKFLMNVGADNCTKYIGPEVDNPGLLCNGHYGTLQFIHAMASLEPGETVADAAEPSHERTTAKMTEWTRFAFGVASGLILPSENFCDAVRRFGAAGTALAPPAFPSCSNWTVQTFFGFRCANLFTSTSCATPVGDADIARAATGALLHMVQDSYSRSHAGRGETALPRKGEAGYAKPEIRCRPIDAFYRYSIEQKAVHGAYDKAPVFLAECQSADVMDPVTAGARLIWLADHKCDATWAVQLIDEGVIRNRMTAPPADAAACRKAAGS